ncbi:SIMPL domain-containing protein [Pseudaeromonas sp. ZJS20]|uniref:SIMPL domain-containing protein n=1 Tax=Pseudaeromonas aegiceratis TaxID=3153928 RepID=UPI00390C5A88
MNHWSRLCIVLCLLTLGAGAAELQAPAGPHLITNGVAEIRVEPDMATLSFAVSLRETTTVKVREGVDSRVASLVGQLEKFGVQKADIDASNLHIAPEYDYRNQEGGKLLGYRGVREVNVRLYQLDRISQVVDAALAAGINTVSQIRYGVRDDSHYRQQVRDLAIADSQQKAMSLAKAYEAKLGSLYALSYQNDERPSPVFLQKMAINTAADAQASYLPEPVVFRDNVEVIYNLD